MKKTIILPLLLLVLSCTVDKSIIELSPTQSMLITGKGQGQDAANNPYRDGQSISVVKNLGNNTFSVRIQLNQKITKQVEVKPGQTEEFRLQQGAELYLDSEADGKAKVTFRKA